MKLNIALINPNIFGDPNVPGSYRKARIPSVNLGLGALAAYIERDSNHQVMIIDARIEGLDPDNTFKKIQDFNPDVIGISLCSHESMTWTIPFLKLIKSWKPAVHVTLGNHFASLFPEKTLTQLKQADSIVIGEGEVTLNELISHLAENKNWRSIEGLAWHNDGSMIMNPRRHFISDINTLPKPKRSLLQNEGEDCEMVVEGSRGCAYHCSFCTIGPFFGLQEGVSLRQKTAESIFNEIKYLTDLYPKLKRIRFVDPEFFVGRFGLIRIKELADLLQCKIPKLQICVESRASSITHNVNIVKSLKSAGLIRINMGIESGSQKILDKMKKCTKVEDNIKATVILRELGIDYSYGFMMITPWCMDEDIEKNASLLKKIGKIELHKFFHEMTLIPGTSAFQEMEQKNELLWKGKLSYYSYTTGSVRIERYRKLAEIFESNYNDFFKKASFIYESIRALILEGYKELAENVEKQSDELFLEIFRFCWEVALLELNKEDYLYYAKKCFDLFINRIDVLLKKIDPELTIPIPSCQLPKYSTRCQI